MRRRENAALLPSLQRFRCGKRFPARHYKKKLLNKILIEIYQSRNESEGKHLSVWVRERMCFQSGVGIYCPGFLFPCDTFITQDNVLSAFLHSPPLACRCVQNFSTWGIGINPCWKAFQLDPEKAQRMDEMKAEILHKRLAYFRDFVENNSCVQVKRGGKLKVTNCP